MHAYPTSSRRALVAGHAPSTVKAVRDILGRRGLDRSDSVPDGKTAIAVIISEGELTMALAVDSIVAIPFSPRTFIDRLPSLPTAAAP